MFLHIKNPILRSDLIVRIEDIRIIDLIKMKEDSEIYYKVILTLPKGRAIEIYKTSQEARQRIEEILILCGEAEPIAKNISDNFLIEDLTPPRAKEKIIDALIKSLAQ